LDTEIIETSIRLLEAHGYKVSKPAPRKATDYHALVLTILSVYGTEGVTAADLASDQGLVKNSVGEALHTLAKVGKIKSLGVVISASTGRRGRKWVAEEYYSAAKRKGMN
jgi:predicted transcriptional regulator